MKLNSIIRRDNIKFYHRQSQDVKRNTITTGNNCKILKEKNKISDNKSKK